jgi:DNA polymerase III sliding clamp (beta) subunit (PCNA family)
MDSESYELYIPKKSPMIIKNIFGDIGIKKISFSEKTILFEAETSQLTLHVESNEQNAFPNKVLSWLSKEPAATLKVSNFELSKTIRFFNGIFDKSIISLAIDDGVLTVNSAQDKDSSAKDVTIAAKEIVVVEESTGEATSSYNSKYILDCLDAVNSHWVNIDFITMQKTFCIARITQGETLILLCPTTS